MNTHRGSHQFPDEEERRKWQNPEVILADLGLKSGSTLMDIGCGEGFFALPAARLLGEKGRVYGVDINREAIDKLKKKATMEGISNLNLEVGKAEEMILCEACADIVFFGNVLHDFNEPAKVLLNAGKMLKSTGQLINLDWKKELMKLGPPLQKRFSEEEAIRLIEVAGFKVETVNRARPYHYLITAKP